MKRIVLILMIICLMLSAVACSNTDKDGTQNNKSNSVTQDGNEIETEATPSGEIIEITDESGLLAMVNDLTATYVLKNDIT